MEEKRNRVVAFFDSLVRNTVGRKNANLAASHPVASAVIGIGTMALARRFLPARAAILGGTILAGYITKKYADYQLDQEQGGEAYADVKLAGTDATVIDGTAAKTDAVRKVVKNASA